MISFEEALQILQKETPRAEKVETRDLSASLGAVLAEEIRMDRDAPPFDRSMMDGFALRAADVQALPTKLNIIGESRAGAPFSGTVGPGQAIAILTGAVVGRGADTVVPIEKVRVDQTQLEISEPVKVGQHIAKQAEDMKSGEIVLRPGIRIRPQELAVLAAVGKTKVQVFVPPRVSVLATGDELIPVDQSPTLGQIRESNSYSLQAQCTRLGLLARRFGVAPDDPVKMEVSIREALDARDCLLVSGGISVGTYDYVAQIFEKLKVRKHFHGVSIKPGKPVWFGTVGNKAVFGLPGNPVSSFVIFETLVRPALEKMSGAQPTPNRFAKLAQSPIKKMPRLQWIPAVTRDSEQGTTIEALPWTSSGDFFELTSANALLKIPAESLPPVGTVVEYLPI